MINNILIIIIVILVFYQLFGQKCYEFFTLTRIKSNVDNNSYQVVAKYSDTETASNLIADMNIFTIRLIKKLKETYIDTSDSNFMNTKEFKKGYEITNILLKKFNSNAFQENEPDSPETTSYTTNKGEIISMCLREKQSGENKFHDITVLQFVLLHELAHVVTKEMDHILNFWVNFRFLLEFCHKHYLYKSKDYHNETINYCGMTISYNPMGDKSLTSYFT